MGRLRGEPVFFTGSKGGFFSLGQRGRPDFCCTFGSIYVDGWGSLTLKRGPEFLHFVRGTVPFSHLQGRPEFLTTVKEGTGKKLTMACHK